MIRPQQMSYAMPRIMEHACGAFGSLLLFFYIAFVLTEFNALAMVNPITNFPDAATTEVEDSSLPLLDASLAMCCGQFLSNLLVRLKVMGAARIDRAGSCRNRSSYFLLFSSVFSVMALANVVSGPLGKGWNWDFLMPYLLIAKYFMDVIYDFLNTVIVNASVKWHYSAGVVSALRLFLVVAGVITEELNDQYAGYAINVDYTAATINSDPWLPAFFVFAAVLDTFRLVFLLLAWSDEVDPRTNNALFAVGQQHAEVVNVGPGQQA